MKDKIKRFGRDVLDALYPRHCPFCEKVVPMGERAHPECLARVAQVPCPICKKCGKPVLKGEVLCEDCKETEHLYTEGRGYFLYEGVLREALLALKFRGKREYAAPLGALLANAGAQEIVRWRPDALVPVPVSREKLRSRGYNQAALLAKEIGKKKDIPVREDLIERTRETTAMKTLTAEERRANLQEAFTPKGNARGLRIVLVDDIYTTGATIDATAGALLEAGAAEVFFLTLAIGKGYLAQF